MDLLNIITDVDLATAYLNIPPDIGGSKEAAISQIKKRYRECDLKLKAEIAKQLEKLKADYDKEAEVFQKELDVSLQTIEEKYSNLSEKERLDHQKDYKDEISGVNTVYIRSIRKLNGEYDADVVLVKSQQALLYQARTRAIAKAKGKNTDGQSIVTAFYNFKAAFSLKKTLKSPNFWKSLTPLIVLLVLFSAYLITCRITGYNMNIDNIIISGIYVAIVAVGAVFIYSQGAFDMSLGNATLVCAAIGIMTYAATGNIVLSFILCVFLGIVLGVVNAILANCLRLPVMVMTLTMQSVLSAIYANITADKGGYVEVTAMRGIGGMSMKWIILIVFIIFCVVLFNYTKIGRRNKMIGANSTCARFSGISLMKAGIISFAVSGIGLGLCGFLYITQMGSVNTGTALTSVGLNVIIAINLGGMPTSGGPKSRISAAIVGGFFCTILDEIFAAMGLDIYRYLAKGVIFLIAVCLTSLGDRPKRLA